MGFLYHETKCRKGKQFYALTKDLQKGGWVDSPALFKGNVQRHSIDHASRINASTDAIIGFAESEKGVSIKEIVCKLCNKIDEDKPMYRLHMDGAQRIVDMLCKKEVIELLLGKYYKAVKSKAE